MLLPAGSIALFVGLAGASSAVEVAIPPGEQTAQWAGLAESVGFSLGEAPGCPGVSITRVGEMWRVAVCRESGEEKAARVAAVDSDEARDRALLTAAQLLYGLGALPPGAAVETIPEVTVAGLVASVREAPARPEQALAIGLSSDAASVDWGGASSAWMGPSVTPAPVRPPGKPWISFGGGGQAREDALAVGVSQLGIGWRLPGGVVLTARGELVSTTELTLPQVSGWEATLSDRTLGAGVGWWEGPAMVTAGGGVSRREANQMGDWRSLVTIPWVELTASTSLIRVGPFALGPTATGRRELRDSEVRINGRPVSLLTPTVISVGLTAWVGELPPP